MSRLSQEKRNQIILIGAVALGVCLALWYVVIGSQNEALSKHEDGIRSMEDKIYQAELRIRRARAMSAEFSELREKVSEVELQMIPVEQLKGRKWLVDKLVNFLKDTYDVRLTNLSNDPLTGEQFLVLPKFAYSAAAYDVEMRAFYHEFGRFLADFENSFPYMRIQNLVMWPLATASAATGPAPDTPEELMNSTDIEQLGIRMRIVVLYKPPST
ncbi:MAG: hypothetical protein O2960_01230 [Verrucomicrobia bacterium]|nr:hypothetical protein [Verrucomicrobiota bacterium]